MKIREDLMFAFVTGRKIDEIGKKNLRDRIFLKDFRMHVNGEQINLLDLGKQYLIFSLLLGSYNMIKVRPKMWEV